MLVKKAFINGQSKLLLHYSCILDFTKSTAETYGKIKIDLEKAVYC